MLTITLLLVLAALGHGIAQWRRLPVIPVLLITGILLSVALPEMDRANILRFLELGLVFLVFNAGIELNPRRFKHQTRQVLWVGLGQFVLVGLAGYSLATQLNYSPTVALYLAFATAASSTLVVLRQLKASQQMFQPFGRLVTGVLLLQDILAIAAIVALSRVTAEAVALPVLIGLGEFLLLCALAAFAHLWLFPRLERLFKPDEETLLLIALAVLFLFLGAAHWLDLPLIAGAFLAGFSLSVFPLNGLLRGLLSSLSEFFQALFFVALGSLVLFTAWWIPAQALLFALLVIVATPLIVTALAEWQGQSSRSAIESGLLLAQTSELSLVIGLVGLATGRLDNTTFSIITLTAVVTMTLTPFLARDSTTWALLRHHPGRRRSGGFIGFRDHSLLIGFGRAGMWLAKDLQKAGHQILVIDDDASVIHHCEKARIPCLRGDGTDPRMLARAGLTDARMILVNLPRPVDVLKVLRQANGVVPVVARAFEQKDIALIEANGGIPVSSADAAFEKFMEWFDKTASLHGDGVESLKLEK